MKPVSRVQTVIRLKPEVMERVKYRAKSKNMSVNAFMEEVLEQFTMTPPIPKLPKDYKIDPMVKALSGCIPMPSQEVIDSDPRLAYILGK